MLDLRPNTSGESLAEGLATPLELAQLPGTWRRLFGSELPHERAVIRGYARRDLAPGALLYSAGEGASTLIVGFAGQWMRLMLPAAAILQNLDSGRFDLLLLLDRRLSHFRHGVDCFADSFHALCAGVDDLRRAMAYRHLITFGTSMGALPALRFGHALKVDRAIGIGARFPWDINRMRNDGDAITAFDPVCACRKGVLSPSYALAGETMAIDMRNAAQVSRVMPHCHVLKVPFSGHNLLAPLLRNGTLSAFLGEMLDLERDVDGEALRAMFANQGQ